MDEFAYNAVNNYFKSLGLLGYINDKKVNNLLVLLFLYHLIYNDYRGYVKEKDYSCIEQALNCLYSNVCLIPYPDYLKMGKLKMGEMAEVISRIENLTNIEIEGGVIHLSDITDRLDAIEDTKVVKGQDAGIPVPDIDTSTEA